MGQKELVDIIADQAELDQPFDPEDKSQIDRIIHCTYCALPYFNVSDINVVMKEIMIFNLIQVRNK